MVTGRVVSVNVELPRNVLWNNHNVTTGIFKEPVAGRVIMRRLGLDGDKQTDLTIHDGPLKAVYAYPSEHYVFWKTTLHRPSLPWGMFGENLTTQGLLEDSVRLRDEYRVGSARVIVTQLRFPCYKLGIKLGTMEMISRFQASGRSGFYLSVMQEELIRSDKSHPTISEAFTSKRGEK